MKYFRVEEEYISAYPHRVEVLQDSEAVNDTEYETDERRYITLGYNVFEEDEEGNIWNIEFYPVATDFRTFESNALEVLEQIKRDYPAGEWQNNYW